MLYNMKNKKFYKKNGFLVLRGFYSENFYKNILRSIFYFLGAKKRRVRNDFESMHFHKTLLKLRLTKKFSASYKKLQNLCSLNEIFHNKKLLDIVGEILNCDCSLLSSSGKMLRLDAPQDKIFSYGFHQDSYYYNQNPKTDNGCVVLFPLTKTKIINGTLKIIKGSHKAGRRKHKKKKGKNYYEINNLQNVQNNIVSLDYNVGDILILDLNTIHASGDNLSKYFRISAGIRFHNTSKYDFKPFSLQTIF
jgi:ectoine hydroxylase-related dioxygenase (phytanoyl-CoA dioxygenase family)